MSILATVLVGPLVKNENNLYFYYPSVVIKDRWSNFVVRGG